MCAIDLHEKNILLNCRHITNIRLWKATSFLVWFFFFPEVSHCKQQWHQTTSRIVKQPFHVSQRRAFIFIINTIAFWCFFVQHKFVSEPTDGGGLLMWSIEDTLHLCVAYFFTHPRCKRLLWTVMTLYYRCIQFLILQFEKNKIKSNLIKVSSFHVCFSCVGPAKLFWIVAMLTLLLECFFNHVEQHYKSQNQWKSIIPPCQSQSWL